MAKQVLIFLDFTLPNVCQEVLNLQFLISGCLLYQHAYSPIILYGDHLPPHPLWLLPHFHAEDISNPYTNVHILQTVWWSFTPRPYNLLCRTRHHVLLPDLTQNLYTFFPAFCSWLPIKGTLLLDIEFWSQWVACFVLPGKTQPFSNVLYICRGFQEGGGLVIGEPRQGKGNFTPLWKGIHKVEYTIEIKKDFKN